MRTNVVCFSDSDLAYVRVYNPPQGPIEVPCPFCGQGTVIPADDGEPVVAGCEHLDVNDYLTADDDGFSVWFRRRPRGQEE